MIGSPSAETGIGPLITVWMPTSLRMGSLSAAGNAKSSSRSILGGKSSRPKSRGGMPRHQPFDPSSQPPMTKEPESGFR